MFGPKEYEGMEIVETYTLQNQLQGVSVMKQLRWGKTVANDLLVTLDNVQLASGFLPPVLEETVQRLY